MPKGQYIRGSSAEERFWAKIDPCRTDGCMLFIGGLDGHGYGLFRYDSKNRRAHHFLAGTPPVGLEWDHSAVVCGHRNCVYPEHLEAVTHAVNVLRGNGLAAQNAIKTECIHGHLFTPENTYLYRHNGRPKRKCRTCALAGRGRR
jgi:hypothetical protein